MHRLMSEMLKISQNTPLEKVDEGLLNAWNAVLQIAAKDGDQTAIRIIMKNYGKETHDREKACIPYNHRRPHTNHTIRR